VGSQNYLNKNIVIIGAGSTGRSLARFFVDQGAHVVLSDQRPKEQLESLDEIRRLGVQLDLGGHTQELLLAADLIAVSPGVPLSLSVLQNCQDHTIPISGEIEIAWQELSGTMIAITGTNGKSTVTSLMGAIFKAWGKNAFVGGNLGDPLINAVGEDYDWHVVELSSFQLEAVEKFRPHYGVLLNISEDHLDRYPDMASYINAKQQIFKNQTAEDIAVLNFDDPLVMRSAEKICSRKIFFSSQIPLDEGMSLADDKILWRWDNQEILFPVNELRICGQHNQENVMAAMIPLLMEGCPPEIAWAAVRDFKGLKHRMEYLGQYKGSDWYNDSKGTNVGSVVKSLAGLKRPVILIAGGKDKNGDLTALIAPIKEKVEHLILIGEAAPRMSQAFRPYSQIHCAQSLHEAVKIGAQLSAPGATVILSPGCSSFDMFENFTVRGDAFTKEFQTLAGQEKCVNGS
jgi:UDP-N-acetylmuramoylalanine--D-glutamate ligase